MTFIALSHYTTRHDTTLNSFILRGLGCPLLHFKADDAIAFVVGVSGGSVFVWFDPLTPKQALLFHRIGQRLEKLGCELLYTSREYDYTVSLFERVSDHKLHVIGEHGGGTLMGKMKASADRMQALTTFIEQQDKLPDLSISFSSPDATRVAFGIGIPRILFNDTPHAVAVGKLTIPLANKVIVPASVPVESLNALGASATDVVQYDGVDEVEWLRDFEPDLSIYDDIGIDPDEPFILARPEESSAAYYLKYKMQGDSVLDTLINKAIPDYEGKFVILPRDKEQARRLRNRFKGEAIIPDTAMDSRSLIVYADMAITGGGTIAREAALLGTRSFCYFPRPLDVNLYLIKKGFPLVHTYDMESSVKALRAMLESPRPNRAKVSQMLQQMTAPGDVLLEQLREMGMHPV